jgi:hypothetical protein
VSAGAGVGAGAGASHVDGTTTGVGAVGTVGAVGAAAAAASPPHTPVHATTNDMRADAGRVGQVSPRGDVPVLPGSWASVSSPLSAPPLTPSPAPAPRTNVFADREVVEAGAPASVEGGVPSRATAPAVGRLGLADAHSLALQAQNRFEALLEDVGLATLCCPPPFPPPPIDVLLLPPHVCVHSYLWTIAFPHTCGHCVLAMPPLRRYDSAVFRFVFPIYITLISHCLTTTLTPNP